MSGAWRGGLSRLVSPDTGFIGVMLPYTPLHHLLLEEAGLPLVMTSGNRGGEPIALGNREAMERLADIAEIFLLHNRDILIRVDDSVVRPMPGALLESGDAAVLHLRRARGFVPVPLPLPERLKGRATLLGLGAELKNTICLSRGGEAFVSQHIGDLQNLETSAFQAGIARHLAALLQVEPAAAALDAHPDFVNRSTCETGGPYRDLPRLCLQHHFAHAEAVLAENGVDGPALVLALDGTGYAPPELDEAGSVWGGELLLAHPVKRLLRRIGSLALMPLPGGEAAIRQPWRIAHGFLHQLGLLKDAGSLPWLPEREKSARLVSQLIERRMNTPPTSSAGRLFDAVAALLGVCLETTYEGQAAIRLEEAQFAGLPPPYSEGWREFYAGAALLPCPVVENPRPGLELGLDTGVLFSAVFEQARSGVDTAALARAFHFSLAGGLADLALAASRRYGVSLVGLSGGVMQNMSLALLLKGALRERSLEPLTHHRLPPNDGCISFGQTVWALAEFISPAESSGGLYRPAGCPGAPDRRVPGRAPGW